MPRHLILLCAILIAPNIMSRGLCQQASKTANIDIVVKGPSGEPVSEAIAQVFLWSGSWDATSLKKTTDAKGMLRLVDVPANQYLTVSFIAEGLAPTCEDMTLTPNETRRVEMQLFRPISGSLKVVDEEGNAIEGAVLTAAKFSKPGGGSYFYRHGKNQEPIPFSVSPSNHQGIIALPPMPEGALVDVEPFHTGFVHARLSNLPLREGELATIVMPRGVKTTLRLVVAPESHPLPTRLNTRLSTRGASFSQSLYHQLTFHDSSMDITMAGGTYESLELLSLDDAYCITPSYYHLRPEDRSLLTLDERSPTRTFEFLVRKNLVVEGRLSGYLANLTSDCVVLGLYEDLDPAEVNTPPDADAKTQWSSTIAEVEPNGRFRLKLPPGKCRIKVAGLRNAVSDVDYLALDLSPHASTEEVIQIPDLLIRKLEPIRGKLVDAGSPIVGMVRLFNGVRCGSYVNTNQDGEFELPIDDLLLSGDTESESECGIMGFTLSGSTGLHYLGSRWRQPMDPVEVDCQQDLASFFDRFRRSFADWGKRNGRFDPAIQAKETARLELIPAGKSGQIAPDFGAGSWLNTSAKSLQDFRGKWVLLDFWFIGCGPCEQDLPTVKLCQQLFGPEKFSVVSVHVTSQSAEQVQQYAAQHQMNYPIVVDDAEATIQTLYKTLGVHGYPGYILIDPEGRIVHNDQHEIDGVSLRTFKVEKVLHELLKATPKR